MAMIGSMGDVAFSVSSRTVRTLDGFQRSGDTGIGTHDIIGQKSETEYTGLPPESCSSLMSLGLVQFGLVQ